MQEQQEQRSGDASLREYIVRHAIPEPNAVFVTADIDWDDEDDMARAESEFRAFLGDLVDENGLGVAIDPRVVSPRAYGWYVVPITPEEARAILDATTQRGPSMFRAYLDDGYYDDLDWPPAGSLPSEALLDALSALGGCTAQMRRTLATLNRYLAEATKAVSA